MFTLTKDRSLALAVLLFVGIMLLESRNIPGVASWQPYGSSEYPRVLLGIIALLAIIVLVKSMVIQEKKPAAPRLPATRNFKYYKNTFLVFCFFGMYAAALPVAGYIVSSLIFMVATIALLLGVSSPRKWIINLGVSFSLIPLVYVIFRYGLNVFLP